MALGFASALSGAGMEVAEGFVRIGYDDAAVESGLLRTEAMTQKGVGVLSKLTLGLAAFAGASAFMAVNFDDQMRHIAAQLGLTDRQLTQMRASILKLSGDTGIGPQGLADALLAIERNGYRGAAGIEVLTQAAHGQKIGLGQTADIAKFLTGVMNIYGKANLSAAHAMDIFTAASRNANIAPAQLALLMGRIAPLAQRVGVSFADVAASAAALAHEGVPARSSVAGLMGLFQLILKPTKTAKEMLASVGLTARGLKQDLATQGLYGTLELLDRAFGGNTASLTKLLGSAQKAGGVFAILGNKLGANKKIFDQVRNSTGDTNKEFGKTEHIVKDQLQRDFAKLQAFMIGFGTTLLPVVSGVANALGFVAGILLKCKGLTQALSDIVKLGVGTWVAYKLAAILAGTWTKALGGYMLLTGRNAGTAAVESKAAFSEIGTWVETADGMVLKLNTDLLATGAAAKEGAVGVSTAMAENEAAIGTATAVGGTGALGRLTMFRAGLAALATRIFVATVVLDIVTHWLPQGKNVPNPLKGIPIAGKIFGFGEWAIQQIFGGSANNKTSGKTYGPKDDSLGFWLGAGKAAKASGHLGDPGYGFTAGSLWEDIRVGRLTKSDLRKLRPYFPSPGQFDAAMKYAGIIEKMNADKHAYDVPRPDGSKPPLKPGHVFPGKFKRGDVPFSIGNQLALSGQTPGVQDDLVALKREVKFWTWVRDTKKLSKDQIVSLNQDIASADSQIQSIDSQIASKSAAATRKREAEARKAFSKLMKEHTTIPADLVIAFDKANGPVEHEHALEAERAWLSKQIKSGLLHGQWLAKAHSEFKTLGDHLRTLRAKVAKENKAEAKEAFKLLTTIPRALVVGYEKAQLTATLADDIKALQAQEDWLNQELKAAKKGSAVQERLLKELVSVHTKLRADRKKAHTFITRAEAEAFIRDRGALFSQYSGSIFQGRSGGYTFGSDTKTAKAGHVTVIQHFTKAPTSHFVNARAAAFAARHAL